MGRYCAGITVALFLWVVCALPLFAQNRTTVQLEFDGQQELISKIEERVSRLLTEFNRASYFNDRPDLTDQAITEAGKTNLLEKWDHERFRCPKTTLTRTLVSGRRDDTFEIRSIPILVGSQNGDTVERSGILVLDALGRVDGFLYQSQRESAPETGTITVRTEPSDAVVVSAIGGGTRQRSPARFKAVPADAYAFTIRKEKYQSVLDTTFAVRANESVERTVNLAPKPGWLQVNGVPEEGTLKIDGTTRPIDEGSIKVKGGDHQVSISKQYFVPWDSTVSVSTGDTVVVELVLHRRKTAFTARSDPGEAMVVIDGTPVGTTPIDTTLAVGRTYTIQFEKKGFVPSPETRVTASPGSALDRRVVLTPVELRSNLDEAHLSNLRAQRSGEGFDLRYALQGQPDETYTVAFEVYRSDGTPVALPSTSAKGATGGGLSVGTDKLIRVPSGVPEGASVRLTLKNPGPSSRLLYIVGGAVAVGGGALAALLMGGDGGGSGSSFPPPPGLPK